MKPLHRALIEAVVYISTAEGSDGREDDEVRILESIFAGLNDLELGERDELVADVRSLLAETTDPEKRDELQAIIDSLSE